jgi:RNA polymerase II elongation factor ELL
MVHLPENSIHELYLRAASATKKNAPLKLHANVVGKLTVEQREIGDELRDKIRESTQDAAAQKSSRATVFMDTPPDTQTASKKRKEPPSSMFRKPLRPSDKVKPTPVAPSSTPPGNKPTLSTQPSVSQPHQGGVPLRKRLVHCLARGEKPEDELFKLLGASDRNSSLLPEIIDLLDQVSYLKKEIQTMGF